LVPVPPAALETANRTEAAVGERVIKEKEMVVRAAIPPPRPLTRTLTNSSEPLDGWAASIPPTIERTGTPTIAVAIATLNAVFSSFETL
jgi:hypothetical protein